MRKSRKSVTRTYKFQAGNRDDQATACEMIAALAGREPATRCTTCKGLIPEEGKHVTKSARCICAPAEE